MKTILGRRAKILANEFVDSESVAQVTHVDEQAGKLVLTLDHSPSVPGITYGHVVASPRLSKDGLQTLLTTGRLGCAVTWVPTDRFNSSNPFDLSWWRGGAAAVVDIELT